MRKNDRLKQSVAEPFDRRRIGEQIRMKIDILEGVDFSAVTGCSVLFVEDIGYKHGVDLYHLGIRSQALFVIVSLVAGSV